SPDRDGDGKTKMKIEVIQIIRIAEHSRIKSASAEFEPAPWINQGKQISFYARALFDSFKPDEQETKPE
ncbi:MAG: hypothetical protein DMF06_00945, partial [Verrucomicrobia bacterium]